ncbi:histidine-type phosphatase [Aeromicrobium stalagmiti]|uniref:histidine-type phosphatase n=1 Tax=Aeromicrobium stalagmiti TaxID=2738988 RepID=UPI0015691AA7|nr:histidine-type phosphatase [Aeromicrobium stalagmiti]NRQ50449.1 histidine-type phosphatase [Aeromicrobium stalagmiti]
MFSSIITFLLTVLSTVVPPTSATGGPGADSAAYNQHYYANQTPYGDAATAPVMEAPDGYRLTFVETVGRHGARTLTSSARERRSLAVWSAAKKQGALTDLGAQYADDVTRFQKPEQQIGYGNLSSIGAQEWQGIGRRTADAYGDFLRQATRAGDQVVFKTSPVLRTIESADAMRSSLQKAVPGLEVADYVTDPATLLIGNGASINGNRAVEQVLARPEVVAAAEHLLGRLYDASFVDALADPVEAALDVYLLYCTAPGMAADTDVTFEPYVPLRDAKVLAYAVDAKNFYQYGPGVAGEDSSYRAARLLLDDFFAALDDRLAGGDTAAVFRLAHGETTMPFAALIDLPGSQEQAPAGSVYTYDDNDWRGFVAGRLGGNIEWAAYASRSGKALVTVRYNEQPVKLASGCRATTPYFYRPAELRRCLD